MYKLTLLLIPLLFLTSCTIDGNNEKSSIQPIQTNKTKTGTTLLESPKQNITIETTTKDFGSGFTLSQTDEETKLSYNGKIIKTWLHTPPKQVPFVWDEACNKVWRGFEKLTPKEQSSGKQGVWDTLTEKEKKDCMKENYAKYIRIEPSSLDQRFYLIINVGYEWVINEMFDTISGNTYIGIEGSNKGISFSDNYIFILTYGNIKKNEYSDKLYIFDKKFQFLKKWTNNDIFTKINSIKEIDTQSVQVDITEIKDLSHEESNKVFTINL